MDSTRTALRRILAEAQEDEPYPLAGAEVSGLRVGDEVPNTDSISASLTDYKVLPGIREIPMEGWDPGKPYSVSGNRRVERLIDEIKTNGWIAPLIVVVEREDIYILEGVHRLHALHRLGVASFPALVVMDNWEGNESLTEDDWTDYGHGPTGVAWALIDGRIITQDDPEYTTVKWTSGYADDIANFHMWATSEMRANFHGRYDPEQKVITLGSARRFYSDRAEREFKIDRIAAMLKAKWPDSVVLHFPISTRGSIVADCRQIMRTILTETSPEEFIQRGQDVCSRHSYINCKLFAQLASGHAKLEDLPETSDPQPGDIVAWPPLHYAIYLGGDNVMHVGEWGADFEEASLSQLISEYEEPVFLAVAR